MQPEASLISEPVLDAAGFQALTGVSDSQLSDLRRFQEMLAEWNAVMNLVGPATIATYWNRHVLDSWQLMPMAPEAKVWADLGAGAGLPGVVLAILLKDTPGAKVHLVESMAKRCRFLSEVVQRPEPAGPDPQRSRRGAGPQGRDRHRPGLRADDQDCWVSPSPI
jgi:16S rRNA (guanine527-N7)-methyltransferase